MKVDTIHTHAHAWTRSDRRARLEETRGCLTTCLPGLVPTVSSLRVRVYVCMCVCAARARVGAREGTRNKKIERRTAEILFRLSCIRDALLAP